MSGPGAARRIVLGISGASGAAIGLRVAERLAGAKTHEIHLVVTAAAERTIAYELGENGLERLVALADRRHPIGDIGAPPASGSFRTEAMIVAPCSIHTLSAIAAGLADNLLVRAADVHLKERRRLVLVTRETPLHLGHLRAMTAATEAGAIVLPPVPAFYRLPQTVGDIVDDIAARAIRAALPGTVDELPEWEG